MIHSIKTIKDPFINLIDDDPVRPNIPKEERILGNKEVLVLIENNRPEAVVCVSYQEFIPSNENELNSSVNPTIAVFYTIWSYNTGSGKKLIFDARRYIKETKPEIKRFVTLSPQTDLARKFHMSNKARELRVNSSSINYEYT